MRRALILLGLLFAARPAGADQNDDAQIIRGCYLATAGDCIACHTGPAGQYAGGRGVDAPCGACHRPKNLLHGDRSGERLQGWFAPNLTANNCQGIGNWSVEDIVQYLRTGANARSRASGPMAEVVGYSTSLMTEADLRAIAVYLKDQPGRAPVSPAAMAPGDARMRAGEAIYIDNCVACHRHAWPGRPGMPSFGWRLSDQQVADVATHMRNSWGNAAPAVAPEDAGGCAGWSPRGRTAPSIPFTSQRIPA